MQDSIDKVAAAQRQRRSAWLLAIFLEIALVLSWSGGFIGIRFASAHAPVVTILFWRSLVSGLLLLPWLFGRGPRVQREDFVAQVAFGVLAMAGYLGSFAVVIAQGVPTGLVALITDMLPLVVAILSWPVLGQTLTAGQWLGSALGAPLWACWLPVAGTVALALGTLRF